MAERIQVVGLREFRTNLRQLDRTLPRGLRVAGNKAAKIVVDNARPRVPLGPGVGGHAVDSIRALSTQSSSRVAEGGARYPYMPWLDFGGIIRPYPGQEKHRAHIKKGRFIWAAFADHHEEVLHELDKALRDLARDAGLRLR